MKNLTLKEYDIAQTLINAYDAIEKVDAIKYIKDIFGSTFDLTATVRAYNWLEANDWKT